MALQLLVVLVVASSLPQQPWQDTTLPVDRRVDLLLSVLTDAEKSAQLAYHTQGGDPTETGRACGKASSKLSTKKTHKRA